MKNIGLDLDGVLYDWHGVIYDYIKHRNGLEMGSMEFWNKARNEKYCYDLLKYLVEIPILYTQRNILPRNLRTVNELAKTSRIYYITTRPNSAKLATHSWVERSKLPYPNNVIITQDKRPHIAMLECDYFVDDSFHIIDQISEVTNAILYKNNMYTDEDVVGYNYIESLDELLEAKL